MGMEKKVEVDILLTQQNEITAELESLRKEIEDLTDIELKYKHENSTITYNTMRGDAEMQVMRKELLEISEELEGLDQQFEMDSKTCRETIEQDISIWEDKLFRGKEKLQSNKEKIESDKISLE